MAVDREEGTLVYLYGIVPGTTPEPPAELRGLDGSAVRLARFGEVAAIVGEVPAAAYADGPLNQRLDDLAWVGERGLAHERVLDWFAQAGPVVPLSLFSLHHDLDRVEARLRAEQDELKELLDRLQGHKEWGVKLWRRDEQAREGVDRLSPSLQALAKQIEDAPEGRRYLLERKRDGMRAEEVRAVSRRVSHELFAELRSIATRAVSVAIPADVGGDRTLLLHSAYLVDDARFERFHAAVNEHATRLGGSGFEIELTGPWPPYHFTDPDDD